MIQLEKYSMGIGDRFAQEGAAQLAAFQKAQEQGVNVTPVWNKSHREHTIVSTVPADVRREADQAVRTLSWKGPYRVDADHIGLKNVDLFMAASDFFTLDVADFIGKPVADDLIKSFADRQRRFVGSLTIPGIREPFEVTADTVMNCARKFLPGVLEAGAIYRRIEAAKGKGNFITEVSMDETDEPQTPLEMLFILAAIAEAGIPAQTIAPKFHGRFNKGVNYVGDVGRFAREFEHDLAVIAFAVREFGLPANLKLSVHSGSDKFSLYAPMRHAIQRHDAGLHLKTAGTTWLEEVIGLAEAGGEGLEVAKEIYRTAFDRMEEFCKPYATVIDIRAAKLPSPQVVAQWTSPDFVNALRHDPVCPKFDPNLRQLLHVGYKAAAEMGERYLGPLQKYRESVGRNVTTNIYERHLRPLFIGDRK
jgi:hypothetical protein